jgi:Tol biopolymer transport system component
MVVAIGSQQKMTPAPAFGLAANGDITYSIDGDIYARDLGNAPERLLVGGPETDVYPFFSRDGTHLAFFRLSDESSMAETLMVANADGTDVHAIMSAEEMPSAAWSPSGDEFAIIAKQDGKRTLSIVGIANGAVPRTIELPVTPFGELDWRPPDGRELIFLGNGAIYAVRADGTEFRQLTDKRNASYYWGPYAISPDGTQLAYTQQGEGDQVTIRMLNLVTLADSQWGGSMPPPAAGVESGVHWGSPVFSPDGNSFVFGRYWGERDGTINHQVFVATVANDGADATPVGELHRSQSGVNPFGYGFSPDGSKVIIQDTDVQQTWLANPDGGEPQPLEWGAILDSPNWQRLAPSGG